MPSPEPFIEVISTPTNLTTEHIHQWEELTKDVAISNPFFESWSLLPAMEFLDHHQVDLLFVWNDAQRSLLLGFFPLKSRRFFSKLPLRNCVSWKHIHNYLATPLIRKTFESLFYDLLFDYVDKRQPYEYLLSLRDHCWHPNHEQLLKNKAKEQKRIFTFFEREQRALLNANQDFDDYLKSSINGKRRKEYRRLRKRLADLGDLKSVCYSINNDQQELNFFIDSFLQVENDGWKRRQGTSLLSDINHEQFVRKQFTLAAAKHKLHIQLLLLDGNPIAGISCFITKPMAYLFKIGYLETFEQYSPGVLVALDLTEKLCAMPDVISVDSCAKEGHSMIEKLWRDKQLIVHYRISTKRLFSPTLLKGISLIKNFTSGNPSYEKY